jgi:RNA polymerase sigma-70 factor (ECF subfamily)
MDTMTTLPTERSTNDRLPADARLTAALARDLDGAFPILVAEHQDRLYTIALRMLGDPHEAEEATQDALVRAYRALAGYDHGRTVDLRLRGWLATIVLNVCRTRLARRTSRGRPAVSLDVTFLGDAEPRNPDDRSPAATAQRRDEHAAWNARLLQLPPAYRAAVILRHVDGLSYPEAAVTLGRSEGTVKSQVHRGIGLLRAMLEAEAQQAPEEMTA